MRNLTVKELFETYQEDIINDTIALVNIPSVSSDFEKIDQALQWMLDKAQEHGFKTYTTPGRKAGIIEFGPEERGETIGVLVHLDVVPEGDLSLWHSDPYKAEVRDGKIYGRGSYDNKGAVISVFHGLRAVKEAGIEPEKTVQIILGTQEEVEWTDMEEFLEHFPAPDYGFTPDGAFPLQNTEKGYMDVEFQFKMVGELGCSGDILSMAAGHSKNTIPESAQAEIIGNFEALEKQLAAFRKKEKILLENLGPLENQEGRNSSENQLSRIRIKGKGLSVHSSLPEKGENALCNLCDFLATLNLKEGGARSLVDFVTDNFSKDCYGKAMGLYVEDEYHEGNFVHRTTLAPTYLRTKFPENPGDEENESILSLSVNLRTRYGTEKDFAEARFSEAKEKYGAVSAKLIDYDVPVLVSKDKAFAQEMALAYEEATGKINVFSLDRCTTYAKAMENIVIWGPLGEGRESTAHEANEHIYVADLMAAGQSYANFFHRALSSKKSLK